ncbi:flagellar biosynthesis anti-sigma factor FlgM [Arsenophonus nasoniae]|uniref:Negative regulator of flagellin synthesis n=1 Tax=Arsenophonus nasoniae TaxID=638 RepID=D2TYH3_9GAMM|nr:flagellar biosynthesis anti-sigma factor FlgM [Arsenophonus nasoniae]QBY42936.1 Negative regulator of flagellin synthesis [Arsenophonus nasoniae]WGM02718.1 flagellar biosynthesis anti-sigma factor FlgM [Arsenophonus nasoniae]WGM06988.1 flagellar biosynthesis anti-sigma factor FlgM [Arsenophonus nasoniae]WGM11869.1 flagellar biosynthesis anti-sigma factor FlgM [Arsenophonus nasoniae]WGM16555.1 flagellar biosynthesis anti-sigma factor FlgM [Arsenophonus nasoniae]
MSIEKTTPLSGITALSHHEEPQPQQKKVKQSATSEQKDPIFTLSLSGAAEKLLQANNKDIREQKVEQIRQKIEHGELTTDAEKIADVLIKLNTSQCD